MEDHQNPYLPKEAVAKEASGLMTYIMEELGDARLNCQHLKQGLADAQKMIAESSHRDHFYEVAGHLIDRVPKYLLKLEKALEATSLAVGRLDYEEIKQSLMPEKVEELEGLLKDVRIRNMPRRSEPLTPKEAAKLLEDLSGQVEKTGSTGGLTAALMGLLDGLPPGPQVDVKDVAAQLRQAAIEIEFDGKPKASKVASLVKSILASLPTQVSSPPKVAASETDENPYLDVNPYLESPQ